MLYGHYAITEDEAYQVTGGASRHSTIITLRGRPAPWPVGVGVEVGECMWVNRACRRAYIIIYRINRNPIWSI